MGWDLLMQILVRSVKPESLLLIHRPLGWSGNSGSMLFLLVEDAAVSVPGQSFQNHPLPLWFAGTGGTEAVYIFLAADLPFCFLCATIFRKSLQIMSWSKFYVLQSSLWNLGFNACTTVCKRDVYLNDTCVTDPGAAWPRWASCENNWLQSNCRAACGYQEALLYLQQPALVLCRYCCCFFFLISCQLLRFCRDTYSSLKWG